ncbi:MAG TPA: ABC transporter permease [Saliniramus sp.]|nr:ABC transporter permease [Saliniramus sp.]
MDSGSDGARAADGVVRARGEWTAERATAVERAVSQLDISAAKDREIVIDLGELIRLDTLGALVLSQLRDAITDGGGKASFANQREEHRILLKEVSGRNAKTVPERPTSRFVNILADVGRTMVMSGQDVVAGIAFLGEVFAAVWRIVLNPRRFRATALVNQIEYVAFRGVPIITLISFLVGAIIAQQSIFQLQRFGATTFVVDLVGILVLRELGVLLTSIMVAGRSGSAFTAEIGSMKMREEIDALRVMGLDPIEVLIVPRLLALVIGLPLLTFLSSLAALFGAMLVAWFYGGIGPDVFVSRLRDAIALNTFFVGLIKAPFMAMVIGVIACIEGMAVKGSAESLGRQVTSSVVKAIFMVIVMDGLFAIFFAAIDY